MAVVFATRDTEPWPMNHAKAEKFHLHRFPFGSLTSRQDERLVGHDYNLLSLRPSYVYRDLMKRSTEDYESILSMQGESPIR